MFFSLNLNFGILTFLTASLSFAITYVTIPTVVRMARFKKLFDTQDERKLHKHPIPRLGGIAVFAGFFISTLLFYNYFKIDDLNVFLAALIIILFIGVKDDILVISPFTKLIGQIVSAAIVVFFSKTYIENLYGFFDIFKLNHLFASFLSILYYVLLINAFNFIDGVDGLAASLGAIAAFSLGIWFYFAGFVTYSVLSFIFIVSLIAFLRYNLFSIENKVFLGDTGSMIIGLTVAFLTIKFLNLNLQLPKNTWWFVLPAPSFVYSIVVLPVFDFIRIVIVRISRKQKPYAPDTFHLHHIFIRIGITHKQITLIYSFFTIFFIVLSFILSKYLSIRRLLLLEILITLFFSFIPEYVYYLKRKKSQKR